MTVFLIVLGFLLGIITVILLSPVSVCFGLSEDFYFSVKLFGVTLYDSQNPPEPKKKKKKKKKQKKSTDKKKEKPKEREDNLFQKIVKKRGFTGAVKELCAVGKYAVVKLARLLSHFTFKNIYLDISVATDNAAHTAIEYGAVCAVVYPIAEFLNSVVKANFKKIDVRSDFDSRNPTLKFDFTASCAIFWLLLFAVAIFKEYNDFFRRNELK